MVPLIVGILIAIIAISMAKDLQLRPRAYAIALVALPCVYMMFGLSAGDIGATALEFAFGLPFFIIGYVCYKKGFKASGILVTALWALHAAYDIFHHMLVANDGVPGWYPAFCFGFDVMIIIYLARLVWQQPNFDINSERAAS